MAVHIPREDRITLLKMIRLPPPERDRLLAGIRSEPPRLRFGQFATAVAAKVGTPQSTVEKYIRVLGTLRASAERNGLGVPEFLNEVLGTIRDSETAGSVTGGLPSPAEVEAFRIFVGEVLDLKSSLAVSIKAWNLLTDTERAYSRSRIMTDLRSVFLDAPPGKPVAAVVLHSLRITYVKGTGGEQEDFYVELDSQDLNNLKAALERAILKEKEIIANFGDKVPILSM